MTNEEADVMRRMLKYCYGASSDVDAVLTEAHQLLAQHADDQQPTTLPWLVETFEGYAERINRWTFTTHSPGAVFWLSIYWNGSAIVGEIETEWDLLPVVCTTRGDVRRLPVGLLVSKKKGEVE